MNGVAFGTLALLVSLTTLAGPALPPDLHVATPRIPLPGKLCKVGTIVAYVRSTASGGDGSARLPFKTVQEALRLASARRMCAVDVYIEAGSYSGDVVIDRRTRLLRLNKGSVIYEGSLRNTGGFNLDLSGIRLREAANVGIEQVGGILRMSNSQISDTTAYGMSPSDGIGLIVAAHPQNGGATAILHNVSFTGNSGQAIRVSGSGTTFWATDLTASGNKINSLAKQAAMSGSLANTAAIDIGGGARAFVESYAIQGNEFFGLLVHDQASVFFNQGVVSGTKSFAVGSSGSMGGHNIVVTSLATLQLNGFISETAAGVGLLFKQSFVSSKVGELRNNVIGLATLGPAPTPDYIAYRCLEGVTAHHNQTDASYDVMPVPDPNCMGGPNDPASCTAFCRTLQWVPAP